MDINLTNRDKIIALLREGTCPICGKRYKMPLQHISKTHGIPKNDLKDILLISHRAGFATPEFSQKVGETIRRTKPWLKDAVRNKDSKYTPVYKEKIRRAVKKRYAEQPELLQQFKQGQLRNAKNAAEKSAAVTKKAVMRINPDNGETKIYTSLTEAAKDNNITAGNISRAARGLYALSGGFKWTYT